MKILIILMTLINIQVHAQGVLNEKGNGGDVYTCNGQTRFLDSAHMKHQQMYINRQFNNTDEFNNAFIEKLSSTLPNLASEYLDFLKSFKEGRSDGYLRAKSMFRMMWISGIPKEYNDENLRVQEPDGCSAKRQAAYREETRADVHPRPYVIKYYYNNSIVDELERNADELSWLLVHEWLWNYGIDNAEEIRLINAYLHSEDFFNHNQKEVFMELTLNNFNEDNMIRYDGYQRVIRDYLSLKYGFISRIEKLNDIKRSILSSADKEKVKEFNSLFRELMHLTDATTEINRNVMLSSRASIFNVLYYSHGPYRNEVRELYGSYTELKKYYYGEFRKLRVSMGI